ncbi:MAG TPA: 2'-5' RNA ligase family protein [Pyrinomonadaceae bacterium]|nr:2'-5' RNA ligase family protein [Pyrinomonadaceae bacterium]
MTNATIEKRLQLSLYVTPGAATRIEAVRKLVDPVQSHLIPAHVTLCRQDELDDLDSIRIRLRNLCFPPLTLRFGAPVRFLGHGLLLECVDGSAQFQSLRRYVLASRTIREQMPHITLAHPRNPLSPGNTASNSRQIDSGVELTFPSIYLIEQEGRDPWRILERYDFPVLKK